MGNERKALVTRAVIAAVLGIVVVFVLIAFGMKKNTKDVDGIYAMGMSPEDEITTTTFCLSFNAKEGTYQVLLGGDSNAVALETGTFLFEDGMVTTKTQDGQNGDTYEKDGDYLVAADFLYEGTVPDEDQFDAVCSCESADGMSNTVTFCKDGTYTEEAESGVDKTADAGSYKRVGNVIERTSSSGNMVSNYYIYQGKITNSFYLKK